MPYYSGLLQSHFRTGIPSRREVVMKRTRRCLIRRYITKQGIRSASETFHLLAQSYEMSRGPLEIGSSRAFFPPFTFSTQNIECVFTGRDKLERKHFLFPSITNCLIVENDPRASECRHFNLLSGPFQTTGLF